MGRKEEVCEVAERRDRAARRGEVREGRGSIMVNMSSRQFLSGTSIAPAGRACTNGSRLFMKQKYSLNVQIIPGERENFEVSEKRFDREVLNAGVQRELRRRSQFENSQDGKKRKVEEKKLRRRFMNRGRNTGPLSWDQYFGGDLANLNSQFGGEDLEFKFLQSETTIPCNAFDSLFSDEA